LDVFACVNVDGKFSRPRNLGVPLNSGKDDFAIYMDDDTKNGLFPVIELPTASVMIIFIPYKISNRFVMC